MPKVPKVIFPYPSRPGTGPEMVPKVDQKWSQGGARNGPGSGPILGTAWSPPGPVVNNVTWCRRKLLLLGPGSRVSLGTYSILLKARPGFRQGAVPLLNPRRQWPCGPPAIPVGQKVAPAGTIPGALLGPFPAPFWPRFWARLGTQKWPKMVPRTGVVVLKMGTFGPKWPKVPKVPKMIHNGQNGPGRPR